MRKLFALFVSFFKVGILTFGGGYAMLPILQREVVEKKGWATDEELTDYFAIGQCTPGVIAVNTATFVGYKYKGIPGGICASLGVIAPSIVIISSIAAFLSHFADIPVVQHALAGVNACVVALIASGVIKLGKSAIKDKVTLCIYFLVLLLAVGGSLLAGRSAALDFISSPAALVVLAGVLGVVSHAVGRMRGGDGA